MIAQPRSVVDRSAEILDSLVAALEARGETPLGDLADLVGSSPSHLAQARWLYNLRLSCIGHPDRIHSRILRRRAHWRLAPIPRTHQ